MKPHLDLVQEEANKLQYKLSRIATTTWSLIPEVHKAVYSVAAEPIVLYVASIWHSNKVSLRRRLLSIQRGYSTVPTDALNVLSGVVPLDLLASIERDF